MKQPLGERDEEDGGIDVTVTAPRKTS